MRRRSLEVEAAQMEAVVVEDGVSRKQIVHQLDMDEGTVSKIFNGNQDPHPLFWYRLGKIAERSHGGSLVAR